MPIARAIRLKGWNPPRRHSRAGTTGADPGDRARNSAAESSTASSAVTQDDIGLLFFIPVLGLAVGARLGALMGKFAKISIDKQFQDQVRDMVQPGASARFLVLEKVTPDKAVEAMSK